ncbi:MAG: ribonuclease P [Candidatus Aenigmarchaeota archaeon]|nr:ribonuclease P [Candidatus Aenigmarchaeota archaeon]NIP40679.1 ribonuclease P [Candidatus Aenigmarchaeota archaeon]NIQ18485.1 ribonuclease P [Candidatus Aenigmarchaeota archaeon]NIS73384.1 ribonuclease P [Candidatus Aenigmarchaeota archaeon]
MVKSKQAKPSGWKRIAKERVSILFKQAGKEFRKHPERSKRYVELSRKIGMRYNVRIPKDLRRRFCSKCSSYLRPGVNCRVRTSESKQAVTVTCLVCGFVSRHPYIREKQNIKQ